VARRAWRAGRWSHRSGSGRPPPCRPPLSKMLMFSQRPKTESSLLCHGAMRLHLRVSPCVAVCRCRMSLPYCFPMRRVLYRFCREHLPSCRAVGGRGMQISYKRVPVVRKTRCTSCGLCGSVCPHACLDVLGGTGVLVQPDACTSEGFCVSACRESAIQMRWVRLDGDRSIGQWRVRALMLRQPQQSST
jgi:NAD-dependent dihydropyrimidine dehydrogenase PreA subunit